MSLIVLLFTVVPAPLKLTVRPVIAPVGVVFDVMLSKVLFVIVLVGPTEADAPSHAAYVKAAATLGLGVGLGVGASLPAAPAAVALA